MPTLPNPSWCVLLANSCVLTFFSMIEEDDQPHCGACSPLPDKIKAFLTTLSTKLVYNSQHCPHWPILMHIGTISTCYNLFILAFFSMIEEDDQPLCGARSPLPDQETEAFLTMKSSCKLWRSWNSQVHNIALPQGMVIRVVEFSNGGFKIEKFLA